MNGKMKIVMVLAVVLAIVMSAGAIVASDASGGEDIPSVVGTYIDEKTYIKFTLYDDGTAEATSFNSTSLKDVTVPGSVTANDVEYEVTSIGGAFGNNNYNITKITFPASIKELKDGDASKSIFKNALKLATVLFEEGSELEYIGDYAFTGCISLKDIEFPEGLKEIGDNLFSYYYSTVRINKVKTPYYYNLYSLETLALPASLEKMGEGSLPSLKMTIELAEGNTHFTIQNGILYDAEKTTLIRAFDPVGDVVIPSTVKTIYARAFEFQTSELMSEAVYNNTSTQMKFAENPVTDPSIGTVTLPSSVEYIGQYAFSLKFGTKVAETPYTALNIPSKLDADIGDYAFQNNTLVTTMYVGEGRSVSDTAFSGCTNIEEAYILNTSITNAYTGISARMLVLSEGLTDIADYGISNWTNLSTVTYVGVEPEDGVAILPSTLKTVSKNLFNGSAIVTLDLSNIGAESLDSAFNSMSKLQNIKFSGDVRAIGQSSFMNATSLTSLIIPDSIKKIGSNSFTGCTALTSIIVPEGIELGDGVFKDSTTLRNNLKIAQITYRSGGNDRVTESIMGVDPPKDATGKVTGWTMTIPKDVTFIMDGILYDKSIDAVAIENGNTSFALTDGALYTKDMRTLVFVPTGAIGEDGRFVVPDSVIIIGSHSFRGLSDLEAVVFGSDSSLSTVGKYAFYGSGIESFVAPKTLQEVGDYAFQGSSIRSADFRAVIQDFEIGESAFYNTPLESVKFPTEAAVSISTASFQTTKLETVEIHSGKIIGQNVFTGCSSLEIVYLGVGVTEADNNWLGWNISALKKVIIMNADAAVIGSTISANMSSVKSFKVVAPSNSTAGYSAFTDRGYSLEWITILENGKSFILPEIDGISFMIDSVTDSSALCSYTLRAGYDESVVRIQIGGVDVDIEDGRFVITPAGKYQDVEVSGLKLNKYSVTVDVENAKAAMGSVEIPSGDSLTFNIIPDAGYTLDDLTAIIGETSYKAHHDSWITIPEITGDCTITITGVVPETYTVTYMKDGKEIGTTTATYGRTFTPSDKSASWYLYDSDVAYDFTQGITGDTLFFASPVSDSSKVEVDYYAPRGSMSASWLGGSVDNGGTVLGGSDVTFTYDGGGSYDVVGWYIDGKFMEKSDTTITVSEVKESVFIQIAVMYGQAGYKYIVDAPLILPDEEYAKMLWIGEFKDPLSDDYYSNMPSTYTVAGDYLFLLSGKELMRVNLNSDFSNGMPTDTLKLVLESVDGTLQYYGGYIFNGSRVYDLDLNLLVEMDSSFTPVGMHDGAFVSFANNRVSKFTIEKSNGGYTCDVLWSIYLQKHYGKVFIDGDYLYHLPVSTSSSDPDRAIQSIDLVNGKIKDTIDINQWHYGHYYDDGWLTVYDGWAYIASYNIGLFGETNPYVTARVPVLLRVAVEDGMFDKDSVQTMILPNNTQQSGLIVYNDRGYIHSGDQLVVIDMKTFSVIYEETGTKTHGGIVLDTYYATPENDYKVYIYMVPYGNAENIWVYSDDQSKTSAGTPQKIENIGYSQYATTHVRTSASGYIYYYNDSSIFFITGQKYHEVSWVVDGEVIESDEQAVNGEKLALPEMPEKDGYVLHWYNYDGTPVSEGAVVAGDMTIMAVYTPVYRVVFVNDGEVLQESEYEYGQIPEYAGRTPVRASTDSYSYSFKGWNPVITPVIGDTVYTATFTSNAKLYTVTFVSDGSVVSQARYHYGASADGVLPPVVSKTGYDFVSWTPAITDVTGDATYTAVWKAKENVDPDDGKDDGKDDKEERTEVDLSKGESSFVVSTVDKPIDMKLPENTSAVILDPVSLKGKTVSADMKGVENTSSVKGTAYEFIMTVDGAGYDGTMHVTLPYEKVSGEKPVIYFVDGDKTEQMRIVSSTGSSVTFETDHNSVYVVSSEPESTDNGGDSTMLYVCIAAVVLIAVVIAGVLIAKRRA